MPLTACALTTRELGALFRLMLSAGNTLAPHATTQASRKDLHMWVPSFISDSFFK